MPDKAIDVIDEAGANCRLQPEAARPRVVDVELIQNIVAKIARIPPKNVSASDRDVLRNIERDLKLVIFGQDRAIGALASAIKMARSGLGDERRPVGSFLFSGPTGVGKTEVTRQLALTLGVELDSLRHVGVHGAAHRLALDRRAAGLCRASIKAGC